MRFLLSSLGLFVVAFVFLFWLAFFSTRPAATDPATLAGDGSTINYCELPKLDGNGKVAAEIPKGNTPLGCRYAHFPLPILKDCTEPLAEDAVDMRGLWLGVSGGHVGHVERVEQCGSRVVITTLGIIHDFGPNSTGGLTSNDTEGNVWFTIGGQDYCDRCREKSSLMELRFSRRPSGPKRPSNGLSACLDMYTVCTYTTVDECRMGPSESLVKLCQA